MDMPLEQNKTTYHETTTYYGIIIGNESTRIYE